MQLFSISIRTLLLLFLFLAFPLMAFNLRDNAHDFDPYQKTFTKEQVESKIKKMLQKDREVEDYYQISEKDFKIFASLEDKQNNKPEFVLHFGDKPKFKKAKAKPQDPLYPLRGLKVAIDAGHFGGQYAKIEERYIHFLPNTEHGIEEEIKFNEGTLNVLTANRLAKKLQSLGAEVFLTKTKAGESVYPKAFESWLQEDFPQAIAELTADASHFDVQRKKREFWNSKASQTQIFRLVYNVLDLEKRAEKINAFKPHLLITCHYNLGGVYDQKGHNPGVEFDYSLFFVPGAFKKESQALTSFQNTSLKDDRLRYEFVRLLVTDDIEKSIALAQLAKKEAENTLKLPMGDHCNYLNVLCLKSESGIYHRNLTLCRLVHCPILYGEPFCQDNYDQAKLLSQHPDLRINQVVDIYSKAVLKWAKGIELP